MREKYESLPLTELKAIAKARGLRGISTMRKPELIERMLQEDEKEKPQVAEEKKESEEPVEKKEAVVPVKARTIYRRNPEFRNGGGSFRSENSRPQILSGETQPAASRSDSGRGVD